LIVLHGGGGDAESVMQMTRINERADQAGFLAVCPNGSRRFEQGLRTWNAGNCCGYAADNDIDDVGFVRTLIGTLQQEFSIDSSRIYVTGFSNGGMMAYRLGCELSDQLAAIAPVAGYLAYEDCQPVESLSVIAFNGTADQYVPYEGGIPTRLAGQHEQRVASVADTVSFWVRHNQCSPLPQREEGTGIIREVYTDCSGSTQVILYTITGGGHAWPGGEAGPVGDEPTQEISATDLLWDFFQRHPKPQGGDS
jgi:polyhydroxybutyrate depolymerase